MWCVTCARADQCRCTRVPGNVTGTVAGAGTLGSASLPFASIYLGALATSNVQLTGTATAARVATLPDNSGTIAELNLAQTWTATQTLANGAGVDALYIHPTSGNTSSGLQIKSIGGTLMVDVNPDATGMFRVFNSSGTVMLTVGTSTPVVLFSSTAAPEVPCEARATSPQTADIFACRNYTGADRLFGVTPAGLLDIGNQGGGANTMAGFPHATFYQSLQDVVIRNTVTETTILASPATIPAKWMVPGRQIRIRGRGTAQDIGLITGQMRVKLGGTVVADTTATNLPSMATSPAAVVDLDVVMTCRNPSSTGVVMCNGDLILTNGSGTVSYLRLANVINAIDFTSLAITWQSVQIELQ